jgi:two-component system vancomycin resistance associated response regulator VraR
MAQVLIVEDQKMPRENMVGYVNSSNNYKLAGTLSNAAMAELFCAGHQVDLILMDVCTERDENGLDATAIIKKRFPNTKVIIVTSMVECSFLDRAHEAGADSFWYKDDSEDELLTVMNRTMAGQSVFPERTPEVELGLTTSYELTGGEIKVLRLLMESLSYEEIAQELGCSERNVRFHLNNVLEKTGYKNKMQLLLAISDKRLIIPKPVKELRD